MRARTGLWEPQGGDALGPPGHERAGRRHITAVCYHRRVQQMNA
jgi:hypothetical protein